MKKKWGKRALSAGLALLLTAGLCACGKGSSDQDAGSSKKDNGKTANENSALAKENVYRATEIALPKLCDEETGGAYVQQMFRSGDKVYTIIRVDDWTAEKTDIKLISISTDGTEVKTVSFELAEPIEQDYPDPIEEPQDSEPGDVPTGDDGIALLSQEQQYWENDSYNSFAAGADGSIYGIRNYYYQDYTDSEKSMEKTFICRWDIDGKFLAQTELTELKEKSEAGEYVYINALLPKEDGSVNLLLSGEQTYRMTIDKDGNAGACAPISDETSAVVNYNQYQVVKPDGTLLLVYSDENDWTKTWLAEYDVEQDKLGEPSEMPPSLTWSGFSSLNAGADSDLVYSDSSGVYTYNKGDAEGKMKLNFVNSDLNISGFNQFVELDSEHIMAFYTEDYDSQMKAALFTYVAPETIADKAVIVMAGSYIGSDWKQRVVEFNRSHDDYRIVLKEYDSYNTYDDYNAAYTKLNNDIITGGMPDILLADSSLPVENYISKGLIADVGKLIESDEELSQNEYMQNVFDAYSVDGKLYYVTPRFSIITMAAKTSLVGDGSDWSMDKMQQVLAGMGDGAQAIGETTRGNFMNLAMQYCGTDFIDVSTGKCNFNSDDFIAMMEFAKTLPEEINWDDMDDAYWSSYESQYRDNRTLLMQMYIGNFNGLSYQLNGMLGEEFTFVGFPTKEGSGAYVSAYDTLVLSSKSDVQDGAWEFARYYLTKEYQDSLEYGLPVLKSAYLAKSVEATQKPYYTDWQTKEKIEYEETISINGEEITIPPLSQDQLDQLLAYVETVNTKNYYNDSVMNIIDEEMGAFYAGQKTAADTAAVIQSRVQIYVDENR